MMEAAAERRSVSLSIPAKPDYVVLGRLALSAVCRLTPLAAEEVADLKLAITESAAYLMGGERRQIAREPDQPARISFSFSLATDTLGIEVSGLEQPTVSAEERELSAALIKATVDDYSYREGTMSLKKRLDRRADQDD
ncbi:MAG: hypothetical protein NVSMB25_00340 [Thermoleophilaceae bacterium]